MNSKKILLQGVIAAGIAMLIVICHLANKRLEELNQERTIEITYHNGQSEKAIVKSKRIILESNGCITVDVGKTGLSRVNLACGVRHFKIIE